MPIHLHQRLVGCDRLAVFECKRLNDFAVFVQHFDLQLALGAIDVDEQVLEYRNQADFMPKIRDVSFKIVETTQRLDELSDEGFDLSLLDVTQACYRLEKGAIAALVFVERELAYRGWLALTEEAKNTFNRYPYKVDFSNNEACRGDAWTNPKYRRQGIYSYAVYKREALLMDRGIKKMRGIMLTNNSVAQIGHDKVGGFGICAKAHYLRIFGLQFWKETPIKSINNND